MAKRWWGEPYYQGPALSAPRGAISLQRESVSPTPNASWGTTCEGQPKNLVFGPMKWARDGAG
jgi:hypothetical protein